MKYVSWGRYPKVNQTAFKLNQSLSNLDFNIQDNVLAFGNGRSYGDSCLNSEGVVAHTKHLNYFQQFDPETGIIRCGSGVQFKDIIDAMLPRGWFLPVTPGTKFVTVGGAIANDVHGKNHHIDGNFGHFVRQFELLRSNGERMICSANSNADMFYATIGGLGLTGLIIWADIQLKAVNSAYLDVETICFEGLDEFRRLSIESKQSHMYTVAWVDCMSKGEQLGRGIFLRANHSEDGSKALLSKVTKKVPFDFPSFALNKYSIKAFNELYYAMGKRSHETIKQSYYDPYFYPLDGLIDWNKIYGSKGFLQYQFVVPSEDYVVIKHMFQIISESGAGSFLAVLKEFGSIESLGLLSFPRKGICLALDFPFQGGKTIELLQTLDKIVVEAGGAVYPAKDACMSAESFQTFYPNFNEFKKFKDPGFSSNFWRRVSGE